MEPTGLLCCFTRSQPRKRPREIECFEVLWLRKVPEFLDLIISLIQLFLPCALSCADDPVLAVRLAHVPRCDENAWTLEFEYDSPQESDRNLISERSSKSIATLSCQVPQFWPHVRRDAWKLCAQNAPLLLCHERFNKASLPALRVKDFPPHVLP